MAHLKVRPFKPVSIGPRFRTIRLIPMFERLEHIESKYEELNQALASPELETLMAMSRGEVANGRKIDDGTEKVSRAYGRKGYIEASVRLDRSHNLRHHVGP